MASLPSPTYRDVLSSDAWKKKRRAAMKVWKHRCALRPWVRIWGRQCHLHHTHYKRVGRERVWLDVVPLSEGSHRFLHRWLGGSIRVRDQRSRFPNGLQQIAHAWCRFTALILWFEEG